MCNKYFTFLLFLSRCENPKNAEFLTRALQQQSNIVQKYIQKFWFRSSLKNVECMWRLAHFYRTIWHWLAGFYTSGIRLRSVHLSYIKTLDFNIWYSCERAYIYLNILYSKRYWILFLLRNIIRLNNVKWLAEVEIKPTLHQSTIQWHINFALNIRSVRSHFDKTWSKLKNTLPRL